MKISKQEILDILKANNVGEEYAESILEQFGKGLGGSVLDILILAAKKTENPYDDMIVLALESRARDLVNDLEIEL
jgi:hypothetical protein